MLWHTYMSPKIPLPGEILPAGEPHFNRGLDLGRLHKLTSLDTFMTQM